MKKVTACLLALVLFFVFFPSSVFAAKDTKAELKTMFETTATLSPKDPVVTLLKKGNPTALKDFGVEIVPSSVTLVYEDSLTSIATNKALRPVAKKTNGNQEYYAIVRKLGSTKLGGEVFFSIVDNKFVFHQMNEILWFKDTTAIPYNGQRLANSVSKVCGTDLPKNPKLTWIDGSGFGVVTTGENGSYFTPMGLQQRDPVIPAQTVTYTDGTVGEIVPSVTETKLIELAQNYVKNLPTTPQTLPTEQIPLG